jgi:hypothetical protein
MVSLLIMLAVLLVIMRVAGVCLRLTDRSLPRGRPARIAALEARQSRQEERRVLGEARAAVQSIAAPHKVETPLESLQRRFAAGEITVEHYEREVGRLYGLKAAE